MQKANFKKTTKDIFKIASGTFTAFMNDKGLKLSASLSYYTIFSLGPLLLLLISWPVYSLGKMRYKANYFQR